MTHHIQVPSFFPVLSDKATCLLIEEWDHKESQDHLPGAPQQTLAVWMVDWPADPNGDRGKLHSCYCATVLFYPAWIFALSSFPSSSAAAYIWRGSTFHSGFHSLYSTEMSGIEVTSAYRFVKSTGQCLPSAHSASWLHLTTSSYVLSLWNLKECVLCFLTSLVAPQPSHLPDAILGVSLCSWSSPRRTWWPPTTSCLMYPPG